MPAGPIGLSLSRHKHRKATQAASARGNLAMRTSCQEGRGAPDWPGSLDLCAGTVSEGEV
ncbi:hypothetical protein BN1708_001406 [Verticillium longisporum]|uniref:Uncharacterized protein n=1 Tax=Verticillium longisporum TaxID=100787 RepID=A0A0G4MTR5_VERLO|nr:hypothetical protein BN1708_001406 [Verticillium longisporum]